MAHDCSFPSQQEIIQAASDDAVRGEPNDDLSPIERRLVGTVRTLVASIVIERDHRRSVALEAFDKAAATLPSEADLNDIVTRAKTAYQQERDDVEQPLVRVIGAEHAQRQDLEHFKSTAGVARLARYTTGRAHWLPAGAVVVGEGLLNVGIISPQLAGGPSAGLTLAGGVAVVNGGLAVAAATCARHRNHPLPGKRGPAALGLALALVGIIGLNLTYATFREGLVPARERSVAAERSNLPFGFQSLLLFLVGCGAAAIIAVHTYRGEDALPGLSESDRRYKQAAKTADSDRQRLNVLRRKSHSDAAKAIGDLFEQAHAALGAMKEHVADMVAVERNAEPRVQELRDLLQESFSLYARVNLRLRRDDAPARLLNSSPPAIEPGTAALGSPECRRKLEAAERDIEERRQRFAVALVELDSWMAAANRSLVVDVEQRTRGHADKGSRSALGENDGPGLDGVPLGGGGGGGVSGGAGTSSHVVPGAVGKTPRVYRITPERIRPGRRHHPRGARRGPDDDASSGVTRQ